MQQWPAPSDLTVIRHAARLLKFDVACAGYLGICRMLKTSSASFNTCSA